MRLFYRRYGEGPPLIILHGLYGSSDNWVTIAKGLSNTFDVILPDQRNHGQSPHSDIHDYNSMCLDLYELVNELNIKKFFLAGHSMGGKTAVSFATKWPDMIQGLLIADISPFSENISKEAGYKQHREILNAIININISDTFSRDEVETRLSVIINSQKERGMIMKNLQRTKDNRFTWKINALSLLKNLDNIMNGIDTQSIEKLITTGFPVCFLKGEKSGYLNEEDFANIKKLFPEAEIINVHDSGHWIHIDRPDAIIDSLVRIEGKNRLPKSY